MVTIRKTDNPYDPRLPYALCPQCPSSEQIIVNDTRRCLKCDAMLVVPPEQSSRYDHNLTVEAFGQLPEQRATHLICQCMWSLLKRFNMDWRKEGIDFGHLEWTLREYVGIDKAGNPVAVGSADRTPRSHLEGSVE